MLSRQSMLGWVFGKIARSCLKGAIAAAYVVAFVELTLALVSGTGGSVPAFAGVRALEALIGLWGAFALVWGVGSGVVVEAMARTLQPTELWKRLKGDVDYDRAWAAGLFAAAVALGFIGAAVAFYDYAIAAQMAARRNGALTTGAAAAMTAVAALALYFPLFRALRHLVAPLPRLRALSALALLLLVGFGAVLAALGSVDWRVIDFGPAEALAGFLLVQVAVAFWLSSRPTPAAPTQRGLTLKRIGWPLAAGVIALSLAVTWLRFGDEPRSLALVANETHGAKVLLAMARRQSDHDHDGYGARFGGGDCDDHDPRIHPGAEEVRGNGIDEDCDGRDLSAKASPGPSTAKVTNTAASHFHFDGNVLVIFVDTLRADRFDAKHMPRAFARAKNAVVFRDVYAQAPNTPRSVPSFMTSRFPAEVRWMPGLTNFPPLRPAPENTTFFRALKDAGFHTVGVFSHFYMKPGTPLTDGFDEWSNDGALTLHDSNTDIAAPRITDRVVAALGELSKSASHTRFALFTHLFDPHSRYMEHPGYAITQSGTAGLEQKYDGEVDFVDQHLAKIFDALDKSGLAKSTAVVLFSDHGEAFGDHTYAGERIFFHGETLYNDMLRVPLVMWVPGMAGRPVDSPAMLLDLGPTVLDLVKAKAPPSFHGHSLVDAMLGQPGAPEPVFAELLPALSWNHSARIVVEGGWKLYQKLSDNVVELYDLAQDPRERTNVADAHPDRVQALQHTLSDFAAEEDRE